MKRKDQERFIDARLEGINTLQALKIVERDARKQIAILAGKRKAEKDQRTKQSLTHSFKNWMLLLKRIELILPVFIADALEEQAYLNLPDHYKTDKDRYRYMCRFQLSAADLSKIKGYHLLQKYGWYNGENQQGVVRDHRFSINRGYELKLDPKRMSHFNNCEFLTNRDNIAKSDNCSISLEQFNEITSCHVSNCSR